MKASGGALGWLVVFCLAAALGCGGGSAIADPTEFVGTWSWSSGMISADCGVMQFTQDLTGQMIALDQGSGNEVIAKLNDTCQIIFTVSGRTATAKSGQTCQLTVQQMTESLSVSSWTMTASADGTSLAATMRGSALAGLCIVTGNGTLSKQGDAGT